MHSAFSIFVVVVLLVLSWVVWTFNRLIRYRNRTRSGWSDIDVQLQRRHDLIPQLVESVQGYANFEKATLATVTELRRLSDGAAHLTDKAAVEEQIADIAKQLIAVAEDYPDLKASRNFLALQEELSNTEDLLQYARRFYNGAVREFNTFVESFPALLVARTFGFRHREFFSADAAAVQRVEVRLS
jgi:LemA protein